MSGPQSAGTTVVCQGLPSAALEWVDPADPPHSCGPANLFPSPSRLNMRNGQLKRLTPSPDLTLKRAVGHPASLPDSRR